MLIIQMLIPGNKVLWDNKIILVMFKGAKSVADDAVSSTGSKNTEPLTVFTNARLAFNRPDVAFGAANTKVFEAGAGRNTALCC